MIVGETKIYGINAQWPPFYFQFWTDKMPCRRHQMVF